MLHLLHFVAKQTLPCPQLVLLGLKSSSTCCFQQVEENFSATLVIGSLDILTSNPDATIKSKFDIV